MSALRVPVAGLVAAMIALGSGDARADGAEGRWKTETSDTGTWLHVEIAPCEDARKLCGTIVDTNSPRRAALIDRQMIGDMVPDDASSWSGGTIWAPDDDETYRSRMKLDARGTGSDDDLLRVSGCVAFGLICRGQSWTRVEGGTADN